MHLFTGYGLSLMTLYRTVSGRFHQRLEQRERRRVGAPEELGVPLDAEHKAGREDMTDE